LFPLNAVTIFPIAAYRLGNFVNFLPTKQRWKWCSITTKTLTEMVGVVACHMRFLYNNTLHLTNGRKCSRHYFRKGIVNRTWFVQIHVQRRLWLTSNARWPIVKHLSRRIWKTTAAITWNVINKDVVDYILRTVWHRANGHSYCRS